jgi:peptidyl-prolyl cis-trans isomerase B (cyclophilin B)
MQNVLMILFSVLIPARVWVAPTQPMNVSVKSEAPVVLVLTDFTGRAEEIKPAAEVAGGKDVDIRVIYPKVSMPGTYVLWAVPKGKALPEFVGTPLVIQTRVDKRQPNEVMVTRIEPLKYGVLNTDAGEMTLAFYYDVAPNTTAGMQALAAEGYFDGLTFHRIMPDFVIQGGDPKGDGTGGPGFNLVAEFNDRKHEEGVLSMARNGDPLEGQGLKPRAEWANSAGSQFFICLSAKEHLDGRYTAFGKVTTGLEAVRKIAATPLKDPRSGAPQNPPVIKSFQILPVTPGKNPYTALMPNLKPGQ